MVVRQSLDHAYQNPDLFALMRTIPADAANYSRWDRKRRELTALIEAIIRRGVQLGEFRDPHPALTAQFVPGLVRAALLDTAARQRQEVVAQHILRILLKSLCFDGEATVDVRESNATLV